MSFLDRHVQSDNFNWRNSKTRFYPGDLVSYYRVKYGIITKIVNDDEFYIVKLYQKDDSWVCKEIKTSQSMYIFREVEYDKISNIDDFNEKVQEILDVYGLPKRSLPKIIEGDLLCEVRNIISNREEYRTSFFKNDLNELICNTLMERMKIDYRHVFDYVDSHIEDDNVEQRIEEEVFEDMLGRWEDGDVSDWDSWQFIHSENEL